MKLDAIVYTSLNGHTRQYAQMLSRDASYVSVENLKAVLDWYRQL